MKISYRELDKKVNRDLLGVTISQAAKGRALFVQHSSFSQVPVGSKIRSRAVSFSRLEMGDFVLATVEDRLEVRRFVRLDLTNGNTRLVLADGKGGVIDIPFTRLVGRIDLVRRDTENVDPNPKSFLHRLGFRLKQSVQGR